MVAYLIAQAILVAFNLLNAKHDAKRILQHKKIYHAANFGVFTLLCVLLCWIMGWNVGVITLLSVSAFCNRQLSFDIPLNIRRGLPWHYQSTEKPPKAIMDRIEAKIFPGWSGKKIAAVYAGGWVVCLIIKVVL